MKVAGIARTFVKGSAIALFGLLSFGVLGAFSGAGLEVPSAEAASAKRVIEGSTSSFGASSFGEDDDDASRVATESPCRRSCDATGKTCVRKCVQEQAPCLDKCGIDPEQDLKHLPAKDQACVKACFDKSRPCQDGCQVRRASCHHACAG